MLPIQLSIDEMRYKPHQQVCRFGLKVLNQRLSTQACGARKLNTFTTSLAASSAGNPRQDFAAISDDNASQMPSEAIISLPPEFDNLHKNINVSGNRFKILYQEIMNKKHKNEKLFDDLEAKT